MKSTIPASQKYTMTIKASKTPFVPARIIGEAVLTLDKSLRQTARDLNHQVGIYLVDARCIEGEASLDFVITTQDADPTTGDAMEGPEA